MNEFLSEENLSLHKEYIRTKRLRYSIIEASFPSLSSADVGRIYRMKIPTRDKRDAIELMAEIKLHDIFFSSFTESPYARSPVVSMRYGSEANFLNTVFRAAMSGRDGFVTIFCSGDDITVDFVRECERAFRSYTPMLAVDVCEHAYFMDYGFDKERYLLSALPYLDIARLSATT